MMLARMLMKTRAWLIGAALMEIVDEVLRGLDAMRWLPSELLRVALVACPSHTILEAFGEA